MKSGIREYDSLMPDFYTVVIDVTNCLALPHRLEVEAHTDLEGREVRT